MILSAPKLTHYLLNRGLVTRESVVDGDLTIIECSHRNRSFKVLRQNHSSYFVKQVRTWDPQSISAWECEAKCYSLAREDSGLQSLAAVQPGYYAHDPESYVLVIELLKDWESLAEYYERCGQFGPDLASELGRMLSLYHRESAEKLPNMAAIPFPRRVPWILSIHETLATQFESLSGANTRLLEIIQQDAEFRQVLEDLRREWQPSALVHGDVKWDNFIVSPNGRAALKLVDWELADVADPCWDAGAVLQAYLSSWIFSIPANGAGLHDCIPEAKHPLESMQPAIQAFWSSYINGLAGGQPRGLLERSLRYAAARMIQTAYEHMHYMPRITSSGVLLLQTSFNILARPQEAVESLLGM